MCRIPKLKLLPLFLAGLLSLLLAGGLLAPIHHVPSPMLGTQMADFRLPRLDDPVKTLSPEAWRGRPAIIHVFASWCVLCRMESPLLARVAAQTKIPVYGIAWRDTPEAAKAYLQRHGNPFAAVALDRAGDITVPLGLSGVPTTYVVSQHGTILWKMDGPFDEELLKHELLPLLRRLDNE